MYYKYSSWPFLIHIALLPSALESAASLLVYCTISALALIFFMRRYRLSRALRQGYALTTTMSHEHRLRSKAFSRQREWPDPEQVTPTHVGLVPGYARRDGEFNNAPPTAWSHGGHSGRDLPDAHHVSKNAPVHLLTGLAHAKPGLPLFVKKVKLVIRGILHFRSTRRWLAYWNSTPMRIELAQATANLLPKIYRPYQSLRLRSHDRINVLISHYDFVFKHGLESIVLRATRSPVLLGSFVGKSDAVYEVRLSAASTLEREGELILQLYSDQRPLFSTAFTFYNNNGSWCASVGCLQGPRGDDAQERVRNATRDMFGLRPKALVVRLVREIGRTFGCKDLILVGNENRVLVRHIRKGTLLADYDGFWREIGAMRRMDGDYQLSCQHIRLSDPLDMPSHKRSEARKRIALTNRAIEAMFLGFNRG